MAIVTQPTHLDELLHQLGDIPASRVRFRPRFGDATEDDVVRISEKEGRLCELVEGVLVEKPMGQHESRLAFWLGLHIGPIIIGKNLGRILGADGMLRLNPDLIRIPDLSFIAWDDFVDAEQFDAKVPAIGPTLAIEVLSESNTRAEMARKRQEYFDAGTVLYWEIDPDARTVDVYHSPTQMTRLTKSDTLDGENVIPGFALPLATLFSELDRKP